MARTLRFLFARARRSFDRPSQRIAIGISQAERVLRGQVVGRSHWLGADPASLQPVNEQTATAWRRTVSCLENYEQDDTEAQ
jgi:hypothetical protein